MITQSSTARGLAALAVVLVALVMPATAPAAIGDLSKAVADNGARVVAETVVDERTVDLSVWSPSTKRNTNVRLMLPADWATNPARDYPALYLMHGANEWVDYRSWTEFTDVESFLADKPVLTVMPSDGSSGFFTKEWNYGRKGGADYETFHTTELPQILERAYRSTDKRAVAGISIGGYGAMAYAARHPGLFGAAASYSGLLHLRQDKTWMVVSTIRVRANRDFFSLWGHPQYQGRIWRSVNPYDLAEKLRGTELYVSSGNGRPGPFEKPDDLNILGNPIEEWSWNNSRAFVKRLEQLDIPATVDLYRGGTHTWPYWERQMIRSWPVLAKGLGLDA
ncbi:esterase family protein [Svornostia abyssi]|uniref:Esterase family protein n=1 Tax=Svornostia abyssi TaxID=2898438 RepID=A0ABY5PE65_9ACTN|nr:esterase family protein [Parviterribacteraceae bacterium J379]